MQQCNLCSSNPKNKIFNYHVFDRNELTLNTNPNNTPGVLIEGLDVLDKAEKGTETVTEFDNVYANYVSCNISNKANCRKIYSNYQNQSRVVSKLEPPRTTALMTYNTCNNLKNQCQGINTTMSNSQASINNYGRQIYRKQRELNRCRYNRCNRIRWTINRYERTIKAYDYYIKRGEKWYKDNRCDSM